jgi:hypothetical protein
MEEEEEEEENKVFKKNKNSRKVRAYLSKTRPIGESIEIRV